MCARLKARITGVRTISAGAFEVSFEPPGESFRPSQHLYISLPGTAVERAYSLYGGTEESHWRILVREYILHPEHPELATPRLLAFPPVWLFEDLDRAGESFKLEAWRGELDLRMDTPCSYRLYRYGPA